MGRSIDRLHVKGPKVKAKAILSFMDNIPPRSFERWLMEFFGTTGTVLDVVFISRRTRVATSSFFAFVRFYHREEACNAIRVLNGRKFKGYHLSMSEASKERCWKLKEMIKEAFGDVKGSADRLKTISFGNARVSSEPFLDKEGKLKGEEYREVTR